MLNDRIEAAVDEKKQALIDFSEGAITRQRAMHVLQVDYSDLPDLMAAEKLRIPAATDEEAELGGHEMNLFLQRMDA